MREPIPEVFLDIVITKLDKGATFSPSKPTLYKCFVDDIFTRRKTILGDLCRAERIPPDLNNEKMLIQQKFDNTGYPSQYG